MMSSRNALRRIARVPIRMRSAVASIGSVTFEPSLPLANVHRNARLLIRAGARSASAWAMTPPIE